MGHYISNNFTYKSFFSLLYTRCNHPFLKNTHTYTTDHSFFKVKNYYRKVLDLVEINNNADSYRMLVSNLSTDVSPCWLLQGNVGLSISKIVTLIV